MNKNKTKRIIVVEWDDICTQSHWQPSTEAVFKPASCISVGIEISNDRRGIVLAQSLNAVNEGETADCTSIPKGVIKKVRVVGRIK